MKKFLLVALIGMVLAIDVIGIVNEYAVDDMKEIDHIQETTTIVYME